MFHSRLAAEYIKFSLHQKTPEAAMFANRKNAINFMFWLVAIRFAKFWFPCFSWLPFLFIFSSWQEKVDSSKQIIEFSAIFTRRNFHHQARVSCPRFLLRTSIDLLASGAKRAEKVCDVRKENWRWKKQSKCKRTWTLKYWLVLVYGSFQLTEVTNMF